MQKCGMSAMQALDDNFSVEKNDTHRFYAVTKRRTSNAIAPTTVPPFCGPEQFPQRKVILAPPIRENFVMPMRDIKFVGGWIILAVLLAILGYVIDAPDRDTRSAAIHERATGTPVNISYSRAPN